MTCLVHRNKESKSKFSLYSYFSLNDNEFGDFNYYILMHIMMQDWNKLFIYISMLTNNGNESEKKKKKK